MVTDPTEKEVQSGEAAVFLAREDPILELTPEEVRLLVREGRELGGADLRAVAALDSALAAKPAESSVQP